MREVVGDLKEISSKRLTEKLAEVKGGPWAEWGEGRRKKPITQNALARLLRPHNVFPSMSAPRTLGGKANVAHVPQPQDRR